MKESIRERLDREPYYTHPKMKFIPNIIINLFSFIIAVAIVSSLLFLLIRYLVNKFYHLT